MWKNVYSLRIIKSPRIEKWAYDGYTINRHINQLRESKVSLLNTPPTHSEKQVIFAVGTGLPRYYRPPFPVTRPSGLLPPRQLHKQSLFVGLSLNGKIRRWIVCHFVVQVFQWNVSIDLRFLLLQNLPTTHLPVEINLTHFSSLESVTQFFQCDNIHSGSTAKLFFFYS